MTFQAQTRCRLHPDLNSGFTLEYALIQRGSTGLCLAVIMRHSKGGRRLLIWRSLRYFTAVCTCPAPTFPTYVARGGSRGRKRGICLLKTIRCLLILNKNKVCFTILDPLPPPPSNHQPSSGSVCGCRVPRSAQINGCLFTEASVL